MNKEKVNYESHENIPNNVMEQLLYEFSKTPAYQAYLKYLYARDAYLITTLATIDPFKQPTQVARSQGHRNGLYDLKDLVEKITEQREKIEDSKK